MKQTIALALAGFVGISLLVAQQYRASHTPEALHAEWRRTFVEPVTAVRPERFEQMKWHPEDAQVELRAPASSKSKKKH